MTRVVPRPHDPSGGSHPNPRVAASPHADQEVRPTAFPMHRTVIILVTGGLDDVMRVAMMLRGRRYRVRDLAVVVREGVVVSEIRATVVLTASETDLLLERLRRLPSVISADND
jgi:hypothetical protein